MLADISHANAQALLRQRNLLLLLVLGLALLVLLLFGLVGTKDREVVLAPAGIGRPLTISSAGVSTDYLEMVTRDIAYMTLNRSPSGLDYWMESVLRVADASAYGELRAQLVKLVSEQRGSDIAQSFAMTKMIVDPKALTSEVTGELRTFVGAQVISKEVKTYRFAWSYTGLSLRLVRFGIVEPAVTQGRH
jgi:conjugal transfer pilus assembly protein TraE